eukprot:265552-Pleurochrysis_carterae.AAC.2
MHVHVHTRVCFGTCKANKTELLRGGCAKAQADKDNGMHLQRHLETKVVRGHTFLANNSALGTRLQPKGANRCVQTNCTRISSDHQVRTSAKARLHGSDVFYSESFAWPANADCVVKPQAAAARGIEHCIGRSQS